MPTALPETAPLRKLDLDLLHDNARTVALFAVELGMSEQTIRLHAIADLSSVREKLAREAATLAHHERRLADPLPEHEEWVPGWKIALEKWRQTFLIHQAELRAMEALVPEYEAAVAEHGCRCLGFGGWGLLMPRKIWQYPCECATGRKLDQEQSAEWAELERAASADRARQDADQLARNVAAAGVPETMAGWTFATHLAHFGKKNAAIAEELRAFPFTPGAPKAGYYLAGAPGVGKTSLAVAALNEHLWRGGEGVLVNMPNLLARLRESYGRSAEEGPTEDSIMRPLYRPILVVLDDVGSYRATEWVIERFFALIAERHARRLPTIVTSNLPLVKLAESFGPDNELGAHRMARRVGEFLHGREVI